MPIPVIILDYQQGQDMKIKQHVMISDPVAFARGNYNWSLTLLGYVPDPGNWIDAGEIELEINIDHQTAVKAATAALDAEAEEIRNKAFEAIERIKRQKSELLTLTQQPDKDTK